MNKTIKMMFKYFVPMIAVSLLMGGCASKSQAQLKFEKDKLLHDLSSLKNCRIKSAKNLDDGVSSAEIIAVAVIKDCSKEAKYVMNNNMLDKSDESRKLFANQMNGVQTSGVISIILEQRSKK